MLLANAVVLGKLSPFFVIIFSYIFLKEDMKKFHIIAMLIAFMGMLFIVKPSFHMNLSLSLIALGSGVFGGAVATFLRFLRNREKPNTIVFFYAFTSACLSIPLMLIHFKMPTMEQFVALFAAGIFSSCTQFALTSAYKYAPAKEISIYNYSNVIFVTFIGFILWNEIPDSYSLLGYLLIIMASGVMFFYNKNLSKS